MKKTILLKTMEQVQELSDYHLDEQFGQRARALFEYLDIGSHLTKNNVNLISAHQYVAHLGDYINTYGQAPCAEFEILNKDFTLVDTLLSDKFLKKYSVTIVHADSKDKRIYSGIGGCQWNSLSRLFADYKKKFRVETDAALSQLFSTIRLHGENSSTGMRFYIDVNPQPAEKRSLYETYREWRHPSVVDLMPLITEKQV